MNIRYPIYEGVYRILTHETATHRKHLQTSGLTGSACRNMPALQQRYHSRVSARPVPFVGNSGQSYLQDIHLHPENNPCPDCHGHACIIIKC